MSKREKKTNKPEVIKCSSEEVARVTKGLKPVKIFGGNKLPKDWNAEKAMKQMREVSGNWSSVEESLIALGLKE